MDLLRLKIRVQMDGKFITFNLLTQYIFFIFKIAQNMSTSGLPVNILCMSQCFRNLLPHGRIRKSSTRDKELIVHRFIIHQRRGVILLSTCQSVTLQNQHVSMKSRLLHRFFIEVDHILYRIPVDF